MSEDSFLREVEEELRSEKLKAFWRRFAPFIIGGAVLIVLAVGANEIWKWWRSSTAATASDQYYAAVSLADSGSLDEAQSAFVQLSESGPHGYGILARFQQARVLADQGDAEGAIAAYDALASSLDQPRLRELAYVLSAYLAVDHLDAGAVEARVGGLAVEGNPLRNSAREALGLAHYKAGDVTAARARFEEIAADPLAPQDTQLRAFVYLEQLASTGVDVSQELLEEGPATPEMIDELEALDLEALGLEGLDEPLVPATE